MSQFKIAMKKDSMRKNQKLVININNSLAASRLETDHHHHDLGYSSRDEEKVRSESSERPRDVFKKRAEETTDGSIDDHSIVRDELMREVDVGTGLSGALNLPREQGTFKRGESKLVGVVADSHEGDRFRDGFKDIQIHRVDKCGRVLTQKEAYRSLCHGFHGKGPGRRKQEKRKKQQEDKSKQIIESSERSVERMRQVHSLLKSPYIVL